MHSPTRRRYPVPCWRSNCYAPGRAVFYFYFLAFPSRPRFRSAGPEINNNGDDVRSGEYRSSAIADRLLIAFPREIHLSSAHIQLFAEFSISPGNISFIRYHQSILMSRRGITDSYFVPFPFVMTLQSNDVSVEREWGRRVEEEED